DESAGRGLRAEVERDADSRRGAPAPRQRAADSDRLDRGDRGIPRAQRGRHLSAVGLVRAVSHRRGGDRRHAPGLRVDAERGAVHAVSRSRNEAVTYPQSGSFVRFLIDAEGIDAMRRLFGSMPSEAPLATVRSAFQNVYGYGLDEAESRWLAFLAGAPR